MLQKLNLLNWFHEKQSAVPAPMHKDNVLIITAYIKKGVVVVTYKGQAKTAQFQDNTLRNMVHAVRFRQNTESFLSAVAQLLEQLTKK